MPVAVNCVEVPAATWGDAGVTAIDAKAMTFTVACVKLVMLLPAAAVQVSCAEKVPTVVSGPVDAESLPDTAAPVGKKVVPSLAESVHCAAGNDSGKAAVAGPHVNVAAAGAAELSVTVAGEAVSVSHGGTFFVGHSALGGAFRKNRSIGKNRFANRPSNAPAGLGLPGGAAPRNDDKLARRKASPEASEFMAQLKPLDADSATPLLKKACA